jgi:hypothetical protein
MENNITAEEFKKILLKEKGRISENDLMIEFAKLHCEAQLKAILENAKTNLIEDECPLTGQLFETREIDKDSIINAYNLNNIK